MAFAGVCGAGESVQQESPVPAAERPADAKPPPAAAPAPKRKPPADLYFAPPPVPDFMLKKPGKPLTLDEMKQQADEAAEKARRAREAPKTGSSGAAPDASSTPEASPKSKM